MKSSMDLVKEFAQECARTHPECVLRRDDLLMHGFAQGASRMRDEFIRWHDPSDVDSLERDKVCLLRFRSSLRGDGTVYALGFLSTSGVWFVQSEVVYGIYSTVDDYIRDLNRASGIEDAVFVGWRPIL